MAKPSMHVSKDVMIDEADEYANEKSIIVEDQSKAPPKNDKH